MGKSAFDSLQKNGKEYRMEEHLPAGREEAKGIVIDSRKEEER